MKGSLVQSVKELSPTERASLLNRIQAQVVPEDVSVEQAREVKDFSSAQTSLEEISDVLEVDLRGENIWRRLLLLLISSFSTKSLLEVYRDYRLTKLVYNGGRGSLQSFLDLSDKKVKYLIFRKVYLLYRQAQGLIPFFSFSHVQEEGLTSVVYSILQDKIVNPKDSLSDFLSEQEILEIFKTGQKTDEEIKEILKSKIHNYLTEIHPQVFEEVQIRLQSFVLTRLITLFPYKTLMDPFLGGASLETKTEEELNELARDGAPFEFFSRPFERFAQFLTVFFDIVLDFSIFNRIFKLYYQEVASKAEGFSTASEDAFKEDFKGKIIAFYSNLKVFQKTISLGAFIRVLRQDPYYTIDSSQVFMGPRVSEFYEKILETGLFNEWQINTKGIAKKYWNQEVQTFLSADVTTALEDDPALYQGEVLGELPSWGESVLLHFFLEKYGDSLFSYFLKTLMHVVLVNKVVYRNEIEVLEATLSEFSKIERLSFASFTRERREVVKRLGGFDLNLADRRNLVAKWFSIVEVRNQKSLENFYEFFKKLRLTFANIQRASDLSSVMNISYTLSGHKITITEALGICYSTIDKYFSLVELYRRQTLD